MNTNINNKNNNKKNIINIIIKILMINIIGKLILSKTFECFIKILINFFVRFLTIYLNSKQKNKNNKLKHKTLLEKT